MGEKILFNHKELDLSLNRLCWHLIENHCGFENCGFTGSIGSSYDHILFKIACVLYVGIGINEWIFLINEFNHCSISRKRGFVNSFFLDRTLNTANVPTKPIKTKSVGKGII